MKIERVYRLIKFYFKNIRNKTYLTKINMKLSSDLEIFMQLFTVLLLATFLIRKLSSALGDYAFIIKAKNFSCL